VLARALASESVPAHPVPVSEPELEQVLALALALELASELAPPARASGLESAPVQESASAQAHPEQVRALASAKEPALVHRPQEPGSAPVRALAPAGARASAPDCHSWEHPRAREPAWARHRPSANRPSTAHPERPWRPQALSPPACGGAWGAYHRRHARRREDSKETRTARTAGLAAGGARRTRCSSWVGA
jgi:hypothetical protein